MILSDSVCAAVTAALAARVPAAAPRASILLHSPPRSREARDELGQGPQVWIRHDAAPSSVSVRVRVRGSFLMNGW